MTLGEKLRYARNERGLSQNQVVGDQITRNMLSQLENDQASPSVKTLSYLAKKLEVSMSWLLDEEDHGSPATEKVRELYRQGCFKPCMDLLLKEEIPSEEFRLLLCRSAVAYGNQALQSGTLQEAEWAAAIAGSCDGLYLCAQDHLAVAALQLRISLLKRDQDSEIRKRWKRACMEQEDAAETNMVLLHSCLLSGDLQQAEQLLSVFEAKNDFEAGCYALFLGWAEAAKQNYARSIDHLRIAEDHPAIGPVYRAEVYRLLELCYREQNDFRQAYHYAVLRLDG